MDGFVLKLNIMNKLNQPVEKYIAISNSSDFITDFIK